MLRYRHHHHKHKHKYKKTTLLSLTRLIISIGIACVVTVWSIYLESFNLSTSSIGFISGLIVIITLITSILSTPLLEEKNEYKILIISILIGSLAYLSIALYNNLYLFIFASTIAAIAGIIRMDSFDIIFRDQSTTKELNENEGLMYALMNLGWVIGPLIAGLFIADYGMNSVFALSTFFLIISIFFLNKLHIKIKSKKRDTFDTDIKQNIKDYLKQKSLTTSYIICSGINTWFALILIYIPIYMIKSGLPVEYVGFFITASTIPLAILELPISKYSNKFGFRNFFVFGFTSLAAISIICFFLTNIYIVLGLLIFASIFMAMIEPLQDTFFFNHIKSKDEEKYYPIYVTSTDVGSLIGKFSVAVTLLFLPFQYAFLAIAVILSIVAIISATIKE